MKEIALWESQLLLNAFTEISFEFAIDEDMEQNLNQMINFNMIFIQSGVEITSIFRSLDSVVVGKIFLPST